MRDNRHEEKSQQNAENLNALLFPTSQFKQSIEYANIGDVHQTLRKKEGKQESKKEGKK